MPMNDDSSSTTHALSQATRSQPKLPAFRVAQIELMSDVPLLTPDTASTTAYVWKPLQPFLLDAGTQVEDVVGHLRYAQCEAGASLALRIAYSYDGIEWTSDEVDAVLVSTTDPSGNGYLVTAAFTDREYFGRHIRFELGLADDDTHRKLRLSVMVAIKFWGR